MLIASHAAVSAHARRLKIGQLLWKYCQELARSSGDYGTLPIIRLDTPVVGLAMIRVAQFINLNNNCGNGTVFAIKIIRSTCTRHANNLSG